MDSRDGAPIEQGRLNSAEKSLGRVAGTSCRHEKDRGKYARTEDVAQNGATCGVASPTAGVLRRKQCINRVRNVRQRGGVKAGNDERTCM